jgi:hypothetical protein
MRVRSSSSRRQVWTRPQPSAGRCPLFHDRVHARYTYAAEYDLDARVFEDGVEEGGEFPVSVPDQEPRLAAGIFEVHDGFFAVCVTHGAVGCAVAPRIRMRRLACSITANT